MTPIFQPTSLPIVLPAKSFWQSCTQARLMDALISLRRFDLFHDDSSSFNIDWQTTWTSFSLLSKNDVSTNFASNNRIIFATKLLFSELPFHDRLMFTRPDLYDHDWPCSLCGDSHIDSWPHLWQCTFFKERLAGFAEASLSALIALIHNDIELLKDFYLPDSIAQWFDPSRLSDLSYYSLIFLTQGIVSKDLTL